MEELKVAAKYGSNPNGNMTITMADKCPACHQNHEEEFFISEDKDRFYYVTCPDTKQAVHLIYS
jgi:hypothetical protein